MNSIVAIAIREGRQYITPEDVLEVLGGDTSAIQVMRDLLAIIGKQTPCGVEDPSLCAFIAWSWGKEG